jgi:hypothetical protein
MYYFYGRDSEGLEGIKTMSMHKVHFINGKDEVFYDIITMPTWTYFKGYADCSGTKSVCIPLTSVLYVELMNR